MGHDDRDPWERQRGESSKAFAAFCAFRDAGGTRGVQRVATELAKSRTLMARWAARWNWHERAAAWDRKLDDEARAAAVAEVKQAAVNHAKQARMMFAWAAVETKKIITMAQASSGPLTNRHGEVDVNAIRSMAETAIKLERLVLGEPGEIREDRPATWIDLMASLGDEEDEIDSDDTREV